MSELTAEKFMDYKNHKFVYYTKEDVIDLMNNFHKAKLKEQQQPKTEAFNIPDVIKCAICGSTTRIKIIEHGQKHCTNCGNCWG